MSGNGVISHVGGTPLVRLQRLGAGLGSEVLLKLEGENPGGSSKDRIALSMVTAAEQQGLLGPGGHIVEVTSGNTGIGLAVIAAARGYGLTLVVNQTVSPEKRATLSALGAQLVEADVRATPGSAAHARSIAEAIAERTPHAWLPRQFENPANPEAHYTGTGPEIWADTAGTVTHFVASIGTGGTISGTGRYLKERSAQRVQVIGADPQGSTYSGAPAGNILVDGIGSLWPSENWPRTYSPEVVDRVLSVSNNEVYRTLHRLAGEEGLLLGPSGALAAVVALRTAALAPEGSVVVAIAPDRGTNYLTKAFHSDWLEQNGVVI